MDVLYEEGVQVILALQSSLADWDNEMLFLSRVGDPRNSFMIYFLVVFHFDNCLGIGLLWTTIISEWLNLILKWVLQGERPYWWIHESIRLENVTLHQYELTCETGPGSPSGHVMVTSAVLFLVLPAITRCLNGKLLVQAHKIYKIIGTIAIWSVLLAGLCFVSISRVFIATHFPHQVLVGVVLGAVVTYTIQKFKMTQFFISQSLFYSSLVSLALIAVGLLSYKLLSVITYDPSVSVKKAQKWCVNPSHIHLDTTPFYVLVRDAGTALGMGVAFSFIKVIFKPKFLIANGCVFNIPGSYTLSSGVFKSLLSVVILKITEFIVLPKSKPSLFYVIGYANGSFIPVIVIFIVPAFIYYLNKTIFKNITIEHFD